MPETKMLIHNLVRIIKKWKRRDMTWTDYSLTVNSRLLSSTPLTYNWTLITVTTVLVSGSLKVWNLLDSTSGLKDHLLSCPHARPPLLFFVWRGSEDTGSPLTGARVQQCTLGQIRRQNPLAPLWLPIPAAYPPPNPLLLLDCCLFQMVAINLVSDLFYEDSRLSPPKFLSLLVSMPTFTLNTGSFNKAPPPTDNRI